MIPAGQRRATHASGLHSVERELSALHQEVLRLGREDARSVRLSVLNLVAVCAGEADVRTAEATVEHLGRAHPARAIIIRVEPEGGEGVEADISLVCVPGVGGQICAEQVRLTLLGSSSLHLASAVDPLLVPDIPVHLWLLGGRTLEQALQEAAALEARLLIDSDSGEPSRLLGDLERELVDHPRAAIDDLAWARGRAWREQIALAFDEMHVRQFVAGVDRIEVEARGDSPSTLAWMTAGWLLARLTPTAAREPEAVVMTEGGERHGSGLAAVRLLATGRAHRVTVAVVGDDGTIQTRIHIDGGLTTSRAVPEPSTDVSHLVGSVLEEGGDDPSQREAVRWGARLSAGGGGG